MSQQKEKKSDEDAALEEAVNPAATALRAMVAYEDQRYLVQTVSVSDPDSNGNRELTFPVSPTKQITMLLVPELQDHIIKRMTEAASDLAVAELDNIEKLREEAGES